VAQSRNTPASGKNARPVRTGFASTRDDPYRWAGKVTVDGPSPVYLSCQTNVDRLVTRALPARHYESDRRPHLRPEAGYRPETG
jgi:hypothetical protein